MTATENSTRMIDGVELKPREVAAIGRPKYDSIEDERRARKVGLAASLRVFGRLGYGEGVAGHITVRDPEFPDHFWVNPFGMSFKQIRASDLICVDHDGQVVIGGNGDSIFKRLMQAVGRAGAQQGGHGADQLDTTTTARRFRSQQRCSAQTSTGRSLP